MKHLDYIQMILEVDDVLSVKAKLDAKKRGLTHQSHNVWKDKSGQKWKWNSQLKKFDKDTTRRAQKYKNKITREAILKVNAAGLKHQNTGTYWFYYTPTLQIAYDCGQMGIDLSTCEDVTAWRYGNPPESYISTNYRDDKSERGLSCMAILGEREVGSAIFFRDRKKVTMKGLLLPYKGSDGEPLILCYDAPNYDN